MNKITLAALVLGIAFVGVACSTRIRQDGSGNKVEIRQAPAVQTGVAVSGGSVSQSQSGLTTKGR